MVITETITINGKEFVRNYSDKNLMIERDGVQYSEAIDPPVTDRQYTETDVPIESYGEVTEADYQNALTEMGVNLYE